MNSYVIVFRKRAFNVNSTARGLQKSLCEQSTQRSGARLGRDTNNTFSFSLVRGSHVRLCRYVKTISKKTFVLQSALRAALKLGHLQ